MGFGKAWSNFWKGLGSLAETGSWKVEKVADNARTAEALLDRVDEAIEEKAKVTLHHIDNALTFYGGLQLKEKDLTTLVANWDNKIKASVATLKETTDEATKTKLTNLIQEAILKKGDAVAELKTVQESLAAAKPEADKALAMVQQMGFEKADALSQRTRLQISNATAQAKKAMAEAAQSWGTDENSPGALLEEAKKKADQAMAEANAAEQINAATPKSASATFAQMSQIERAAAAKKEFEALMK